MFTIRKLVSALFVAGWVMLMFSRYVPAQEVIARPMSDYGMSDAYCGQYSIVAAANALEIDVELKKVFDSSLMKSELGTSSSEVVKIAELNGMITTRLHFFDVGSLSLFPGPVMLQMRDVYKPSVLHWVTFLGVEDNKAVISDPPQSTISLEYDDLRLAWNGVAIGLTKQGELSPSIWLTNWGYFRCCIYLLGWVTIFLMISVTVKKFCLVVNSKPGRFAIESGGILFGVILASLAADQIAGLGNVENQLAAISCLQNSTAKISPSPTQELVGDIIFDCRVPAAYQRGHVPGAISLPITTSYGELRKISRDLKDKNIVFYCQSANCQWAAIMQAKLECLGVSSKTYLGGYERFEREQSGEQ